MHYKVMPVHGDGSLQPFSATVSVYADSFETVMQRAEALPASDYTKVSYYLFHKELDRIKAEMQKPAADEEALINAIYDATQPANFGQNAAVESEDGAFDGPRVGEILE